MIATKEYPNDSNAVAAAQCHIALDSLCTRNPAFKKTLTQLTKLSGRKRKRGRTTSAEGPHVNSTDSEIRALGQLMDLFNLPIT